MSEPVYVLLPLSLVFCDTCALALSEAPEICIVKADGVVVARYCSPTCRDAMRQLVKMDGARRAQAS